MKKFLSFLVLVLSTQFFSCQNSEKSTPQIESKNAHSLSKIESLLHESRERYEGTLLNGQHFDSYDYKGVKLIFGYFNIQNPTSLNMLKALQTLTVYEKTNNFKIFAVCVNVNQNKAVQDYLESHHIELPVIIEDASLQLAKKLKVMNDVSLLGLNNDHILTFGIKKYIFENSPLGESQFIDYVKQNLSLESDNQMEPAYGFYPQAIDFDFTTLNQKKYKLSDFKGKVVLLFFFSPKCPHCQHEIAFLKEFITPQIHDKGLEVLAVSVLDLNDPTTQSALEQLSIDSSWKVINDAQREIRSRYSQILSIPEVFFIDRDGRVRFHDTGFGEEHTRLIPMRIKHLLGMTNPPLLSSEQYNGVESCAICHAGEYADWSLTPHAHAFETLELKGQESQSQCVGCHTLGFQEPQGFDVSKTNTGETLALVPEIFQNVQCESCHGMGGPHVQKPQDRQNSMEKKCLECHTAEFSLHFDFAERVEKVNHKNQNQILALTPEQRRELLKKSSKNPHELFGSKIKYVGSDSCLMCHTDTHKNWLTSAHSQAFETLKKSGHSTDTNCLACHSVGYGQPGGYQEHLTRDFEGVGCESCHGPGEAHVQSKKKQDIRGLGEDCPFCVVEQICLSCHNAQNDPDFNIYKGLEKIKGHK